MFGTNTKVGFDIGYDAATTSGNILLGYDRQEAVWLPLLANRDKDGNSSANTQMLFKGEEGANNRDTYSVLASFGADFNGKGAATGVESGSGLAQYFATGLAARTLADKGGADLVKVSANGVTQEIKDAATAQIATWNKSVSRIIAFVQKGGNVDGERLALLLPNTGLGDNFKDKYAGNPIDKFKKDLNGRYQSNIEALAKNIQE
ncbi:hypothetical protein [Desulfovibrio ferrophilus]|nr:hypothetical protein [Desulfovibrio ferrophilus]